MPKRATRRRQELGRELRWYTDDDGSFVFRGGLTAEDGARLVQAIQAAESCVSAGTSAGQRAADGLVVLAVVVRRVRADGDP